MTALSRRLTQRSFFSSINKNKAFVTKSESIDFGKLLFNLGLLKIEISKKTIVFSFNKNLKKFFKLDILLATVGLDNFLSDNLNK